MLINDLQSELEQLIKMDGRSKSAIAADMGVKQPHIPRLLKSKFISDGLVALLDNLGYDFKIVYVKKPEPAKEPLVENVALPEDLKIKSSPAQRRERLNKLADTQFVFKL